MELNSFIFKPPKCSADKSSLRGSLLWVPVFVPEVPGASLTEFNPQNSFSVSMPFEIPSRNTSSWRSPPTFHHEKEGSRLNPHTHRSFAGPFPAQEIEKRPEANPVEVADCLASSEMDEFLEEEKNGIEKSHRQPYDFGPKISFQKPRESPEPKISLSLHPKAASTVSKPNCSLPGTSSLEGTKQCNEKEQGGSFIEGNEQVSKELHFERGPIPREKHSEGKMNGKGKNLAQFPRATTSMRVGNSKETSKNSAERLSVQVGEAQQSSMGSFSENLQKEHFQSPSKKPMGFKLDLSKVGMGNETGSNRSSLNPSSLLFGNQKFSCTSSLTNRMNSSRMHKMTERMRISHHVPCILHKPDQDCNVVLMYFHGNGEDIVLSKEIGQMMSRDLKVKQTSLTC